ncbi:MAG: hypothetical protein PHU49_13085, partial [Syntrophorhabdaceae bacterium]|nr:hypothetical protein [Syntrophorhabdaceae bacterium]
SCGNIDDVPAKITCKEKIVFKDQHIGFNIKKTERYFTVTERIKGKRHQENIAEDGENGKQQSSGEPRAEG